MGTHFGAWYPLSRWKPMIRYRKYFIRYRHPLRMTGDFAGMSSLSWGFCNGRLGHSQSGISLAERLPLIRSVKGNKSLLLTKVTKP